MTLLGKLRETKSACERADSALLAEAHTRNRAELLGTAKRGCAALREAIGRGEVIRGSWSVPVSSWSEKTHRAWTVINHAIEQEAAVLYRVTVQDLEWIDQEINDPEIEWSSWNGTQALKCSVRGWNENGK